MPRFVCMALCLCCCLCFFSPVAFAADLSDSVDDVEWYDGLSNVAAALVFVSGCFSTIWNSIPSAYLAVFTLPIVLGLFFYICSNFRIPSVRPDPHEYHTSETWTTTVSSRNGGAPSTVETHTTTRSRRVD